MGRGEGCGGVRGGVRGVRWTLSIIHEFYSI